MLSFRWQDARHVFTAPRRCPLGARFPAGMNRKTHFDVLGVEATATDETIRKAYLVRSKMFHPDRFDREKQTREWEVANEMLKELNESYAVLRDARQRAAYVASLQVPALATASPRRASSSPVPVHPAWEDPPEPPPEKPSLLRLPILWLFTFLVIVSIALVVLNTTFHWLDAIPSLPLFSSLHEVPLPASGTLQNATGREALAPFQITAPVGSNFLVKLVDSASQRPAATIFVRAGDTVKVRVPLGTYEVRYASGTRWYGPRDLFGPGTRYSQADNLLAFKPAGRQYSGYSLILSQASPGNLKASGISGAQF